MTPAVLTATTPSIVTLPDGGEAPVLPDLRGLSARDALRTLAQLGMTPGCRAAAWSFEQTPAPGSLLERGVTCTLVLDRDPSRLATGAGASQ